jgi:hypothetical protein
MEANRDETPDHLLQCEATSATNPQPFAEEVWRTCFVLQWGFGG